MVGRRGFEPLISALRGRCPGPLDERPATTMAEPWPKRVQPGHYTSLRPACKVLRPGPAQTGEKTQIPANAAAGVALPPMAAYNTGSSRGRGRLAQLVRAPRSHRGGRRFKSSIAHQPQDSGASGYWPGSGEPRWRNGRRAAFRAQCPYGCVGSNPSLGTIKIDTRACSSEDRALPCGGRGREFESRQARHFPRPLIPLKPAGHSRTNFCARWLAVSMP